MRFFGALLGMAAAYVLIRYREMIGDMMGGRYQLTVGIGVLVFFWSIAYFIGAGDIFFRPLLWLLPGTRG
jgi:predicted membrane protein